MLEEFRSSIHPTYGVGNKIRIDKVNTTGYCTFIFILKRSKLGSRILRSVLSQNLDYTFFELLSMRSKWYSFSTCLTFS